MSRGPKDFGHDDQRHDDQRDDERHEEQRYESEDAEAPRPPRVEITPAITAALAPTRTPPPAVTPALAHLKGAG
ncbi:hypothetical protein, partial [Streptomyces odonnellii]|uniref:hypothetical protein n=1 Tax=Streptomyces odonnellii TaxID=1417980 RepID=UPI0006257C1F